MIGRPEREEAAPYYFTYIDRVVGDDPVAAMESQRAGILSFLEAIPEERSRERYEPGKWSIRQVWNHVNDAERVFAARAFWFARGFEDALPSFEQDVAAAAARADEVSWASHVAEFRAVRDASLTLFRNLPADAWMKKGTASGKPFTVRSLAFIIAGHAAHHEAILRERYLG
jgi:uncharacterized damage-inducible protein DinB